MVESLQTGNGAQSNIRAATRGRKETIETHRRNAALYAAMLLPAAITLWRYQTDLATYGQVIHDTGLISAILLGVALCASVTQTLGIGWLMKIRRQLGVASFAYAAVHTAVYLEYKWGAGLIAKEAVELDLATGWIALTLMTLLAVTSNNASVRRLGRRWKQLHRWVYAAAILVFAHWWLASIGSSSAYVFAALLILARGVRHYLARDGSRT